MYILRPVGPPLPAARLPFPSPLPLPLPLPPPRPPPVSDCCPLYFSSKLAVFSEVSGRIGEFRACIRLLTGDIFDGRLSYPPRTLCSLSNIEFIWSLIAFKGLKNGLLYKLSGNKYATSRNIAVVSTAYIRMEKTRGNIFDCWLLGDGIDDGVGDAVIRETTTASFLLEGCEVGALAIGFMVGCCETEVNDVGVGDSVVVVDGTICSNKSDGQ